MSASEFAIALIGSDERCVSLGAGTAVAERSSQEVENLLTFLSSVTPYRFLGRSEAALMPGRGYGFLVAGRALRSDWREKSGASADAPLPKALVIRCAPELWGQSISRIADAYGLSPAERALASELAEFGNFEEAHTAAGLDFTAARNALARLRTKVGARNLAETVEHLLLLMFRPSGEDILRSEEVVADMLDLSDRQMAIARMIAGGTSRKEVARLSHQSLASIKNRLSEIYQTLGIESASELSCLMAQAGYVAETFVGLPEGDRLSHQGARHQILTSDEGRAVGYSAYGGAEGPAVVLMHSTITCRHPPSRLVRRLVRQGFRVFAPDRPGFGDTAPAADPGIEAHVTQAARDLQAIASAEKFAQLTLVSRGAGQMAIALADELPGLVTGAVLVNPTPPISASPVDRGPLGAVKRRFARNPASIRLMIGLLLRFATADRLTSAIRRACAQSRSDLAAVDDKLMIEDYLHAAAALREQLDGYVTENVAWSQGWEPTTKHKGTDWTLLFGRDFVLHDTELARAHFSRVLPQSRVRILNDAGQFLIYSHPDVVAEMVAQSEGARRKES